METEETTTSTQPQTTPTQKVYCCSNYPHTESTLIAKFDFVLDGIWVLLEIIFIAVVAGDENPDPISHIPTLAHHQPVPVQNQSIAHDVNYFWYWSSEAQIIVLSLQLVFNLIDIGFTILLLIGVKKKKHAYLLAWFIYNLLKLLATIISFITLMVLASDKVFLGVLAVIHFLYKWYCLWIVKLLMSEIRAVREGYANPLEDGEIDHASNYVPSSDSFTVDKF